MITASPFEMWFAARMTPPSLWDLVDRALDSHPGDAPGERPRPECDGADERGEMALERLVRGLAHRLAAGATAASRRFSAARIASTTAPTVSVEAVAVGDDMDRVRGRPQRRDRPIAIEIVASPELLEDGRGLRAGGVEAALLGPAARPLLRRGVEEQLEVRVRAGRPSRCPARP